MTVYGYMRVSTARQSENNSPEVQRRQLTARCLQDRLRPSKYLEDLGTSGVKPFWERPSVQGLAFKEGDVIVTPKLDRLGRDMLDLLTIVKDFRESGVRLITCDWGEITDDSFQSEMFLTLGGLFASMERRKIRERTMEGKHHQAQSGIFIGGNVPWGCYVETNEHGIKHVYEHPKRQEMIERIQLLHNEGVPYRKVSEQIGKEFTNVDDTPMRVSHTQVQRIVRGEKSSYRLRRVR